MYVPPQAHPCRTLPSGFLRRPAPPGRHGSPLLSPQTSAIPAMSPRSTFSPEYAEAIITGLSQGVPLTHTCRELGVGVSTVYDWMKADETFAGDIARARVEGYDVIAEDCLRIADTTAPGVRRKVTEDGIEETTEDMLGHRKLQVETRLKLLAKWDPKRYGDKIQHTGDGGGAVTFAVVTAVPDPRSDPEATGEA